MSARRRFAALAAAVALAGALAGCGSSKTLPSDIPSANASGLIDNLNLVLSRCNADPRATSSAARQYQSALDDLPDTVDPDVRKVLTETADNLTTLAGQKAGCESGVTGASGLQGFQPDTSTTTTPPPTTESTATTTTTTTSTTQPEAPPPNGNDEGSNGQGPSGQGPPGQQGSPGPGSGGGVGIGGGG